MTQYSHRVQTTMDEARKSIDGLCRCVHETEVVSLREALGRVTAVVVASPIDVPKDNNSAMDGYAMRFSDLLPDGTGTLALAGKSFAGHPFQSPVPAGHCVRIMTGAIVPADCDTVIQQELTTVEGGRVTFAAGVKKGGNVRIRGEEITKGHPAVPAGTRLTPAWIGLLATLGVSKVEVFRKPVVAILVTGDELAEPGDKLFPGQIYDANSYTVGALARSYGAEVIKMDRVGDQEGALVEALGLASTIADLIVTSGGVSVGEADLTRFAVEKDGKILHWEIPMRPGRPMAVGTVAGKPLFCLPGNPVAAAVTFAEFGRAALLRIGGQKGDLSISTLAAEAEGPFKKRPGRYEMQRGIMRVNAEGKCVVKSTGMQGSAMLTSMCRGNCIVLLEKDRGPVAAGEMVSVQPFFGLMGL